MSLDSLLSRTGCRLCPLLIGLTLGSCNESDATSGDTLAVSRERGGELIRQRGCVRCHQVPGVRGAQGWVGPPLDAFSRRSFISGQLPNTPENLVRWIRDPQSVDPKTAMPQVPLSEPQARDIAAYLFSLR